MTREMDAENEYEKAVAAPLHVNVKTAPNRRQFLRLDNIRSSMIVGDLKKEILAKVGLDSQTTLGACDRFVDGPFRYTIRQSQRKVEFPHQRGCVAVVMRGGPSGADRTCRTEQSI